MRKSLDLEGTRLHYYRDRGAGPATARPPAVLLHPWFGCHQMWQPLIDRLDRPSYRTDWYSLGAGDWTAWATPDRLAEAVIRMLEAEDLDEVDVVGNSVGGIVAQLIAARAPDRVRRLVLVGTGASLGGPPTAFGDLVGSWLTTPSRRESLTSALVDALVAHPLPAALRETYLEEVRRAAPDFLAHVLMSARDLDLRPLLAGIDAPTLVIRGEHDSARTRAHVADLLAGLPHARAVEMAGCGHSPMIEEADEFAALIREHLNARSSG